MITEKFEVKIALEVFLTAKSSKYSHLLPASV